MYMKDFVYDGKRLSDYGFIIANINTSIPDNVSMFSSLKFNSVKNASAMYDMVTGVEYNENISVTFDICKNPCLDNQYITEKEISMIMRWLNKKSYQTFRPIYDDNTFSTVVYKGSFDVSVIKMCGNVCGFTLTFNSNAPYGFSIPKEIQFTITNSNLEKFVYVNDSDELGVMYPISFEIICNGVGDLIIQNDIEPDRLTKILNCTYGEVIKMDCVNKIITSSLQHEKLHNDFNYIFPRFVSHNEYEKNTISSSMPCTFNIIVTPARKVGIL